MNEVYLMVEIQTRRTSWNDLHKGLVAAGTLVAFFSIISQSHSSSLAAQSSPVAILHVGNDQNVGYTISVDGSESYGDGDDPFTVRDEIVDFAWDFGDGSVPENGEYLNTHAHVFTEPGTYTITLTVTDLHGVSNSSSAIVKVGTLPKVTVSGNTTSAISAAVDELNGEPGIVYLPPGDYEYDGTVNVPEDVIIEGAGSDITRVYNSSSSGFLFYVTGNNVHITKLKLEGYSSVSSVSHTTMGILAYNDKKNVFIDHCEVFGFSTALNFKYRSTGTIENNSIHHNSKNGYGYGILVAGEAYAMVRMNEMGNNRHSITSAGCGDGGCTACPTRIDFINNHVEGHEDVEQKGYQFDTHAGIYGRIRIVNNTFENLRGAISFRDGHNVYIEGNVFRNIDPNEENLLYGNAIHAHEVYCTGGKPHNSPGLDGLYISDNSFENNSHDLLLDFGKNVYVNCRKMDDLIPFRGNVDWDDCVDPSPPTFSDVPTDHWAYDYIEALYQEGYLAGCSLDPLMYCPENTMTRAESAVFVERGIRGADTLPDQPTQQIFADVPLEQWFAKWSHALWDDGYTAGCGTNPLIYCPLQEHTRAEGCVFFLRMMHGSDYIPPEPTGLFDDVPITTWYADWVEAAYNAGIIPACETEPELRFCPDDPLDRSMAAYMMVQAKGISLINGIRSSP
jgi:PKD repeat protein